MGCGVSKFDIGEEVADSPCHQLSTVLRWNDRAVVDNSLLSKPLHEGGEGEEHAKGDIQHKSFKKVNSEDKGGIQRERVEQDEEATCDKEESDEDGHDRDDSIEYPRSLSFRVYCIPSLSDDDNSEGHSNAGQIKDKQQCYVQNDKKGSRNRLRRRGRMGKGIKTGSAKVKSILRV
ncbi:uncharacterized protein LOC111316522 [Durio zibethinus]|uniref:Uncharacterized protein LOC111316522 n=1 Tax=Durio zibethinus TaxID=66656 RepID=A0A6P6BAT7_DURZI|nr:uncharacterized protein LOC111316522 [Durio zibethinus]